MSNLFPDEHQGMPAKIFDSSWAAQQFTHSLTRRGIPFRMKFITPPKRLKLPFQTAVILLGIENLQPRGEETYH
jgi:hypothetical protein